MAPNPVLRLLRHFLATYPLRSASVVALLTIAGFAEGVSVVALLPFVEIATAGAAGPRTGVSTWLAEVGAAVGVPLTLGTVLALIVLGIVLKAGITLIAMKEVGYAVGRLMTDLRHRLIAAVMAARWSYFVGQPLGVFANAVGAETIRAGATYQQAARLAAAFVQALVYGIATLLVSWKAAVFAVLAAMVGALAFRRVIATAQDAGSRQTELLRQLSTRVTDVLQGIKAIKAMGGEGRAMPMLDGEIGELDEAQRSQVWAAELMRVAQEPLLVLLLAGGIYAAVTWGGESLPALMVLALLFYRLFNRFQVVQEIYQQIAIGESAYWSLDRLSGDAERECETSPASATLPPPAAPAGIEIDSVSFGYGDRLVVAGASLEVRPGEFVVIGGASGGGKTTVLDLIAGLLAPAHGEVRIGGSDLRRLAVRDWRRQVGYVPQEMLLLHDSVYRNVSLGDPAITREDAERALRDAGVWETVAELPQGLDTPAGERGGRFSGGQRQRISLARALARKPSVLLLDEITAALDPETERNVCATLRRLAGRMTIVAVSHQPEMARVADRAVRLDGGRVVPSFAFGTGPGAALAEAS